MSEQSDLVKQAVQYLLNHPGMPLIAEMSDELLRLRGAKTAALKIADERAKEAVELRAQLARARKALEVISCPHVTEHPIWWQIRARQALAALTDEKGKS
jgi:hypothetical protein